MFEWLLNRPRTRAELAQQGVGIDPISEQPAGLLGFPRRGRPRGLLDFAGATAAVPGPTPNNAGLGFMQARSAPVGLLAVPRAATMGDIATSPVTVDRSAQAGLGALEIANQPTQAPAQVPVPTFTRRTFPWTTLGEDSYFYGYGTGPEARTARLGTIEALMGVDADWHANGMERRKIGIGDMSLPGLASFGGEHDGHQTGTEVDIRPVRKDGGEMPVSYKDPNYDQAATQRLVDILRARGATRIYFNDPTIRGVTPSGPSHDNHLHVEFGNAR